MSINKLFKLSSVITIFLPVFAMVSCSSLKKTTVADNNDVFYKAGHRGARGLMPENTIPAMKKGIDAGANTCEFDIQVTKDGKVMVHHDASFNPAYETMPDGSDIPKTEREKYIFYKMNYADIRQFIIGEKDYATFPEQKRIKTYAPLFTELIDSIETFTKSNNYGPVYYMPEIKSDPKEYGKSQPYPEEFVKIVMETLKPYMKQIGKRLIIQCFDLKPLQILHRDYPEVQLALLSSQKNRSIDEQIKLLGFTPDFYLPEFRMITSELLSECHAKRIQVVPWTVNDKSEMEKLIDLGVDGIITDYPDRLAAINK